MEKITLPGKPEWDMETEVLVVGGGPAGVCAAIAAAREGVKVLLIEKGGFSGGMATAGRTIYDLLRQVGKSDDHTGCV